MKEKKRKVRLAHVSRQKPSALFYISTFSFGIYSRQAFYAKLGSYYGLLLHFLENRPREVKRSEEKRVKCHVKKVEEEEEKKEKRVGTTNTPLFLDNYIYTCACITSDEKM